MKRRHFLSQGVLATAGLGLLTASCNDAKNEAATTFETSQHQDFLHSEKQIEELQAMMANGKLTAEQLTKDYLSRIEEIDQKNLLLKSVIEINPAALDIARTMDQERTAGKIRGPLHGIPVLIKDNIDTADKMQTTAGSLAMEGHYAKKDAFLVRKLRDAGAVILGKTNLSEWANFRSSSSCSGWSSRGGQTKSPYILDHNPCGSSSGSGVAVAANLCTVAIGTETDGSITCPASVNGIVGIKPTVGLVSRTGIIPISATQDTAGPMARTVKDAAILLGIIAGNDPDDPATNAGNRTNEPDYISFLRPDGLKGKRIGIEKKPQGKNHYLHALQKHATELIQKQGATIVEIEYLDKVNEAGDAEFNVLLYEFKDGLNRYLSSTNARVKTLKDVIEFNRQHEEQTMPYFKQETLEKSEKCGDLQSEEYLQALQKSHRDSKILLDKLFSAQQLDAICGLTMGPSCSIDNIYGDRWGDVFLTMPAAISGYPHISVPCGLVYDLPVGLSFFGPAFSEGPLISIAYAFEQASKSRVIPEFKKSFLS